MWSTTTSSVLSLKEANAFRRLLPHRRADRCRSCTGRRAAKLAKADLRTLMVGEFPELQGIMGEYYAHHDKEDDKVALAIREPLPAALCR